MRLDETAAFSSIRAFVLIDPDSGAIKGKVLGSWSRGGTCSVAVVLYGTNPDRWRADIIGRAGGGGYDKFGAAFEKCLRKNGCELTEEQWRKLDSLTWTSAVERWSEWSGYRCYQAV